MKYRAIIRESWNLTQEHKSLIWWFAVLPAILTTLVSIVYLAYQVMAFWTSPFIRAGASEDNQIFSLVFKIGGEFISQNPGLGTLIIVVIGIIGLLYLMLPVFTQGALIELVARIRRGEKVSMARGISFGMTHFLPLFEYHLMVKTFSWVSIVTEAAFILRSLGFESFLLFSWIFAIFLFVGLILMLLFTFTEYYIVLDQRPVFQSMMASGGLVIRQWNHILFMVFLMLLISLRIALNIIIALVVPMLILGPVILFTSFTLVTIGIIIGSIVGLVALYFASYFMGVFHVFATAVWTFTFLELTLKEVEETYSIPKPPEPQDDEVENQESEES